MTRYTPIAVLLALTVATPALSQQAQKRSAAAECRAMFHSADTNRDGVLSGRELVAAKLGEADDGPLTLAEFLEECLDQG